MIDTANLPPFRLFDPTEAQRATRFHAGDEVPEWVLRAPRPDLQKFATFTCQVDVYRHALGATVRQIEPGPDVIRIAKEAGAGVGGHQVWGVGQLLWVQHRDTERNPKD